MLSKIDIPKIKAGDIQAFSAFFELFQPKLIARACRFVNKETAFDIVQDVFIAYWENKENIEVQNILGYMYKWVHNKCLDYIKHQKVTEKHGDQIRIAELRKLTMEESLDSSDIFKQVAAKNLMETIEDSIMNLPPRCAEAFRLCYFYDLPHKEVAKIMNVSHRTIEAHIYQAVRFLRIKLSDIIVLIILLQSI